MTAKKPARGADVLGELDRADERRKRVQLAYQRLFEGKPARGDHVVVLEDLAGFCNVYTDMLIPGQPDATARELGKFRVWQRIEGMRFPRKRPADALPAGPEMTIERGAKNVRHKPGPGISDPTD
jgi:hypothetical protein